MENPEEYDKSKHSFIQFYNAYCHIMHLKVRLKQRDHSNIDEIFKEVVLCIKIIKKLTDFLNSTEEEEEKDKEKLVNMMKLELAFTVDQILEMPLLKQE